MASLAAHISAVLLLVSAPSAVVGGGADGMADGPANNSRTRLTPEIVGEGQAVDDEAEQSRSGVPWRARFLPETQVPQARQVRIERRVILRISPRSGIAQQNLAAIVPQRAAQPRFVSRPMDDCLPVGAIAAVQASGTHRLILYLRDRRMVSAQLERACSARDYYSGFYVERNADGQLCVDRDRLLSRTGARCSLSGMAQLVEVADD